MRAALLRPMCHRGVLVLHVGVEAEALVADMQSSHFAVDGKEVAVRQRRSYCWQHLIEIVTRHLQRPIAEVSCHTDDR